MIFSVSKTTDAVYWMLQATLPCYGRTTIDDNKFVGLVPNSLVHLKVKPLCRHIPANLDVHLL